MVGHPGYSTQLHLPNSTLPWLHTYIAHLTKPIIPWLPTLLSHLRRVRVAKRSALPTSVHGVAGSNPAGGEILPEPKRRFIAQSLSCSPFHCLEMTEILLKGCKTLTHPSILLTFPTLGTQVWSVVLGRIGTQSRYQPYTILDHTYLPFPFATLTYPTGTLPIQGKYPSLS